MTANSKTIAIITALATTTAFSAHSASLNLAINGVNPEKGQLVVQVYDSKQNWLSEDEADMVLRHIVPATHFVDHSSIAIELPHGEYAIQVYLDMDSNGELKTNWIGIPKEPVATSNNAKGRMGPPSFKDAKFLFNSSNSSHSMNMVAID